MSTPAVTVQTALAIRHAGATEQSPKKATNDDCFVEAPDLKIFIVCDGVSGHAGGSVASSLAAETALKAIRKRLQVIPPPSLKEAAAIARDAVLEASKTVFAKAQADPKLSKMATTFDLVWHVGNYLLSAHTGDGRVFLYRQGTLQRLTTDHSYVQELIANGTMTEAEAEKSPYAHALVEAVGIQETVRVDLLAPEVQAGDLFLICTDGIYGGCPPAQIGAALAGASGGNFQPVLDGLIRSARAGGSKDDATGIILEFVPGAAPASRPGSQTAVPAAPLPQAKIQALDLSPCFGQLSFPDKTRILELAQQRRLGPGEVLAREGEIGDKFWVMVSGKVRITEKGTLIAEREGAATLGESSTLR